MPVTSLHRDGLPDWRSWAGSPSLLLWAAGVMSCSPVIAGDVDRTLSTKAMDDANDAAPAALSYGQEPGREARSAGTGSLRAGAMRFVVLISCPDKGWQKL